MDSEEQINLEQGEDIINTIQESNEVMEGQIFENLAQIKSYFDAIYDDIPDARYGDLKDNIKNKEQREDVVKTGGSPVYGEMNYEALEEIIFDVFEATLFDIFMDLGSGSGKAPIMFTLLTGGKSIGLEYVQFRHELALQARVKLPLELQTQIEFIQGDMFTYPIPYATIYMVNACMFDEKYPEIVNVLLKYGPPKFRVWNIGCNPLPFPPETIEIFEEKELSAQWCDFEPTTLYWIKK